MSEFNRLLIKIIDVLIFTLDRKAGGNIEGGKFKFKLNEH
jgi:hypothetical protein